jgi:hypothetical protein
VITEDKLRELDAEGWELYHIAEDFSETKNVAAQNRGQLIQMIALWYAEAGRYNVLPIDSRGTLRLVDEKPQLSRDRKRYQYYPGTSVVSNKIAPNLLNRAHSITAKVTIGNGAEGVLVTQGGSSGGYSLYLKDRRLHYAYNYLGVERFHLTSNSTVPDGSHELRFEFEPTGKPDLAHGRGSPGRAQLYVDGNLVGQIELPVTIPLDIGIVDGLAVGRDEGSSVTSAYRAPFAFTGSLEQILVDVSGDVVEDTDAQMKAIMAHQ